MGWSALGVTGNTMTQSCDALSGFERSYRKISIYMATIDHTLYCIFASEENVVHSLLINISGVVRPDSM